MVILHGLILQSDRWFDEEFAPRYPTPPRNWDRLTQAEARRHGFALVGEESYTHEVRFSLEEQVNYLMSQSRVLAALGEGKEDEETVRRWLTDAHASFFKELRATFVFKGSIDYLQRKTS